MIFLKSLTNGEPECIWPLASMPSFSLPSFGSRNNELCRSHPRSKNCGCARLFALSPTISFQQQARGRSTTKYGQRYRGDVCGKEERAGLERAQFLGQGTSQCLSNFSDSPTPLSPMGSSGCADILWPTLPMLECRWRTCLELSQGRLTGHNYQRH